MSPHETPSVAIDGYAIRRIREEKRLTQLYVAKVVGVTTDTVSRWENNRYPTIRRDNAINLAEALEVELDEILKLEEVHEAETEDVPSPAPKAKHWIYAISIVILLAVAGYLLLNRVAPETVLQADRQQPRHAAPGSHFLVRLQLTIDKPLKGIIVKEHFPEGWTLIDAVPPVSSLSGKGSDARWMLRNPAQKTVISYLLKVAESAELGSQALISGEVVANPDGHQTIVSIDQTDDLQVAPLHWVDVDGNGVIDDMEILGVSDHFDEIENLHNEWDKIEEIWDAEGYRWDQTTKQFLPLNNQ